MFRELWHARNLLFNLVRRDLTIRYKSTVLGFLWSFLKPLALTGILWLVFQFFMGLHLGEASVPFTLHLLVGVLAWTFFAGAAGDSLGSIIANANLIKKVKLPLIVFPLAATISHLIHFLLALMVLFIVAIFMGLPPTPAYLLLPAVIALHFAITLAVCLILSSLNVFYRDVASIWELASQVWFYATPIVYPVSLAMSKLSAMGRGWANWLYLLNPMSPVVVAYRRLLLYASVEVPKNASPVQFEMSDGTLSLALGMCVAVTALSLWAAHAIFMRYSRKFADEL